MATATTEQDESRGEGTRTDDGRFASGHSGNPGGQRRMPAELREAFQDKTQAALDVLVAVMQDKKAKGADRVHAAKVILDRAWGRPAQSVELAGPGGGPIPTEPRGEPDPSFTASVLAELRRAGIVPVDDAAGD